MMMGDYNQFIEAELDKIDFSQPLSLNTLSKRLNIKKKSVAVALLNSDKYTTVTPTDVGSNKTLLNVWKRL